MKTRATSILLTVLAASAASAWGFPQSKEQAQEERVDYFKKWLREDAAYIITDEERSVFEKLTTEEEKENFIEQFWFRRDPDPATAVNEFKEEHYRRIAYANGHFKSGKAGWQTDRGRIYIAHGPPDSIESYPGGGTYQRPVYEGGGFTSVHPFEIWRYHRIEGIGEDVELEFVDPIGGGEYRLALNPEEKDALINVPGAGLTWAESRGMASKADRPYFSQNQRALMNTMRAKDSPFQRYEQFARVQAPPIIKYKDLKEIVNVNIAYHDLPVRAREDYFRLNDAQTLVPVTLQVANKELTYKEEAGLHVARVAVYGIVTSITNRIVTEFEDELVSAYRPEELESGLRAKSVYQKVLPLDATLRYKIDLVVKDVHSGRVGVLRRAINPPPQPEDALTVSSVLVSSEITKLPDLPEDNPMFVLGDLKIHPSMENRFPAGTPVGLYLQVYNAGFDSSSLQPSLEIRYRLLRDGEAVEELADKDGSSIYSLSERRVVLIKPMPVGRLEPGRYRVEVSIRDRVKDQTASASASFELTAAGFAARR